MDAGLALLSIRDRRLYRADHQTFEDYCQQRWGFVRRQADRLVQAAETVRLIEARPIGLKLPATESQARELTRIEAPAQRVEAWAAALKAAERIRGTPADVTERHIPADGSGGPSRRQRVRICLGGQHDCEGWRAQKAQRRGC